MAEPFILSLDLGLTHAKSVLFRPDGSLVERERVPYPTPPRFPSPGAMVHDPEDDSEPRFSRDGTRVAFLRSMGVDTDVLAIATLGRDEVVTTAKQFVEADTRRHRVVAG